MAILLCIAKSNEAKNNPRPKKTYLVHRLDQYCSGLLVLGKNIHYARTFTSLMSQQKVYKAYYALCQGIPKLISKTVDKSDKPEDLLTGLIRSDSECVVYDHTMHNPQSNYISPEMQTLIQRCKELESFKTLKGKASISII